MQTHPEPAQGQMAQCGELALFDDYYGLIVLGDPGMGKTASFRHEAQRDENGHYVTAIEFIHTPLNKLNARYAGKTIYIDGFDEVRASQVGQTAIGKLIENIGQLDNVKFRLSCRSLEWDNIDLTAMGALVDKPDDLSVVCLEPLNSKQIETITAEELENSEEFLKEAHAKSFFHLLGNPHNLNLFLSIYKQGETVKNRTDLFEKACAVLMKEKNEAHAGVRTETYSSSDLIDISGLLCTIYMLTNSAGLSLTETAEDASYPYILGEIGDKATLAKQAAKTGVFRQDGTNKIVPCHRTIAEYLSANYLIKLSREGLPLPRVVGMIAGYDDGTLSDLRGLYAWMATLYPEKSDYLISRDPVGILIYGDVSKFSAPNKRTLFNELKRVSKQHPWFLGEVRINNEMGNMVCPDLEQDILDVLNNGHDDIYFLTFVLEALEIGEPLDNLAAPLLRIAQDKKFDSHTRDLASTAYIRIKPDDTASIKDILKKIHKGDIEDDRREMRGHILKALYPSHLSATECLKYIIPEHPNFMGGYWRFMYDFTENTKTCDLPAVAEAIINEPDEDRKKFLQKKIGTKLIIPLLKEYGQTAEAESLYKWLSGMKDRYGYPDDLREPETNQIREYYRNNSEVYKKLFEYWLDNIAPHEENRPHDWLFDRRVCFQGDAYPDHFGHWLLDRARESTLPAIKEFIFIKVLSEGCFSKRFDAPSYEEFFTIKDECKEFTDAFETLSVCPLEGWRSEELERKIESKRKKEETYQKDIEFFQNNLDNVRQGKHWPSLEYAVQKYIYKDNQKDKFNLEKLYAQYPSEYCDAIVEGLENLLKQDDIPTLKKVAALSLESRSLTYGFPFMYGCRATWEKNKEWYKTASDKALTYALATHWVCYNYAFEDDEWFYPVINHKPNLFIEVVRKTTGLKLSKGHENVDGLYQLATEERLQPFSDQLIVEFIKKYRDVTYNNLSKMLHFCLLHGKWAEIESVAEKRAKSKKGEIQNLWQAALYLGNPEKYGEAYEKFLGKSLNRAWSLIEILRPDFLSRKTGVNVNSVKVDEHIMRMLGRIFPPESRLREGGWVSQREDYIPSEIISHVIDQLTNDLSCEAGSALQRLAELKSLKLWRPKLLHAIKTNSQKRREQNFKYQTPKEVLDVLTGGKPHSHRDLKEFIKDHIETLASEYKGSPTNPYQKFWQEKYTPRGENYCRDRIAEDLETRLKSISIHVETEGTHKAEKSSDIKIINEDRILPIEVKKNKNREIWIGIKQLQEQYSIDPKAQGYGIYIALWFGKDEQYAVRKDIPFSKPQTPEELKVILESLIAPEDQHLIDVIVIDLSQTPTSKEKLAKKLK